MLRRLGRLALVCVSRGWADRGLRSELGGVGGAEAEVCGGHSACPPGPASQPPEPGPMLSCSERPRTVTSTDVGTAGKGTQRGGGVQGRPTEVTPCVSHGRIKRSAPCPTAGHGAEAHQGSGGRAPASARRMRKRTEARKWPGDRTDEAPTPRVAGDPGDGRHTEPRAGPQGRAAWGVGDCELGTLGEAGRTTELPLCGREHSVRCPCTGSRNTMALTGHQSHGSQER